MSAQGKRLRVYGQGINTNFQYTGDYNDSPFFGYLTIEEVLQLVRMLPPCPPNAEEEDLCPPAITVLDESNNGLTISATTEQGRYDVFYVGSKSGDAAINASVNRVAEIPSEYYGGLSVGVESFEERVIREYEERYELLAYMSGIEEVVEDEVVWSTRTKLRSVSFERDKQTNEVYVKMDTREGTKKIPIFNVIEVKIHRGSFWTNPHVEIKYIDERGRVSEHIMRVDKKDRELMDRFAYDVARLLPGRVKVK